MKLNKWDSPDTQQNVSSDPTYFINDHDVNNPTAESLFSNIRIYEDGAEPPATTGGLYYIHTDHLGTPRVITDGSNTVVWRWESDPFGNSQPYEDPDNDGTQFTYNLRFPGQYFDEESGKYYNYFRDYDPSTGRYVQSDPIGLQGGLNTYAYANSNPIINRDPLGMDYVGIDANIAFGAGVHVGVHYDTDTGDIFFNFGGDVGIGEGVTCSVKKSAPPTGFTFNGKAGACVLAAFCGEANVTFEPVGKFPNNSFDITSDYGFSTPLDVFYNSDYEVGTKISATANFDFNNRVLNVNNAWDAAVHYFEDMVGIDR